MMSMRNGTGTTLLTLGISIGLATAGWAQTGSSVAPSALVTLEGFDADGPAGPGGIFFGPVFGDGTTGEPFTTPAGQVLVVTGVDWMYIQGTPGAVQTLNLHVRNRDNPETRGSGHVSTTFLDARGNGGASESLASGFVVSPEGRLSAQTVIPMSGQVVRVIVRGYLSPAE